MQAILQNPVSRASYSRMQRAGGDLTFNYDLGARFNALGQTSPSARLITLDPAAIQAEAVSLGLNPSRYAAQVFTHEADHLIDMHRGVWQNTQYAEYRAYIMEDLFANGGVRPSLSKRMSLWARVQDDYPHLQVGKYPFGN